jgi:arginase
MFDPGEREAMADGGVTVIDAAAMRAPEGESVVSGTMRDLATATTGVHVHLDLDVIDRSDGVASAYGADGGPSLETLERALTAVATAGRLTSATICSYNPEFDGDGRAARCGVRLLEALLTAST